MRTVRQSRLGQRLIAVGSFTDDGEARLGLEEHSQAIPDELLVVWGEDA